MSLQVLQAEAERYKADEEEKEEEYSNVVLQHTANLCSDRTKHVAKEAAFSLGISYLPLRQGKLATGGPGIDNSLFYDLYNYMLCDTKEILKKSEDCGVSSDIDYSTVTFLPENWSNLQVDNLEVYSCLFFLGKHQLSKLNELKAFLAKHSTCEKQLEHLTVMFFFADLADSECASLGLPRENILQFQRKHVSGAKHYLSIEVPDKKGYDCTDGYCMVHERWGNDDDAIANGFCKDYDTFLDRIGKQPGYKQRAWRFLMRMIS